MAKTKRKPYLFYVIIWNQALRLLGILVSPLLLRLPPIVLGRLLQHHQQIALGECNLVLALRHIIVDGAVDAQKHHDVRMLSGGAARRRLNGERGEGYEGESSSGGGATDDGSGERRADA